MSPLMLHHRVSYSPPQSRRSSVPCSDHRVGTHCSTTTHYVAATATPIQENVGHLPPLGVKPYHHTSPPTPPPTLMPHPSTLLPPPSPLHHHPSTPLTPPSSPLRPLTIPRRLANSSFVATALPAAYVPRAVRGTCPCSPRLPSPHDREAGARI